MKQSIYPRTCDNCEKVYQAKTSFWNHNKSGVCERTQQKNIQRINGNQNILNANRDINNTTNNNNTNNTITNTNSHNNTINLINLQGCESMSREDIEKLIENTLNSKALTEVKSLLGNNKIHTPDETIKHFQKEVIVLDDIEAVFPMNLQDDLVDAKLRVILEESEDKEATHPLHLLFRRIFLSVKKGGEMTLKNLTRRVMRNFKDRGCEVFKLQDDQCKWVKRMSANIIAELLFMLGTKLMFAKMSTEMSTQDLNLLHQNENPKAQQDNRKILKTCDHTFISWWATNINSSDDLLVDPKARKLIQALTVEVSKDCEDGLVSGWHTLIDCFALLQETQPNVAKQLSKDSSEENKAKESKINAKLVKNKVSSKKARKTQRIKEDIVSTLI